MRLTHYDQHKKRWQINVDYGAVMIDELNYAVGEAIDKLAEYENTEEQESIDELHTEQIRCKSCNSIDCHGCNLFSLSQMLEDGKLNEMMGEDHKIKTDLSVHPVVFCSECEHRLMHKFTYNYGEVLACNDPHYATIRAVNPMHFCSYGKHKEGEEAKH